MHPSDLQTPAVRLREPAVDFDFDILDHPLDLAHEDLEAALGRAIPRAEVAAIWHWHLRTSAAGQAAERTVAERILIWIGGGRPGEYVAGGRAVGRTAESEGERAERRIGLRAAIAIAEIAPHSQLRFTVRELCRLFRVSRGIVWALQKNFRSTVRQAEAPAPGPADKN